MQRKTAWCGVITVLCVAIAMVAPVEAQQLAVVRVESLDSAMEAVATVAQAAGQPMTKEALIGMAMGGLGVPNASFLDFSRPLVVTMPLEGMAMQQKGLVGAVPVTDVAAAAAALSGRFGPHTEADGLHSFGEEGQPVLYAVEREGYLVVGASAELVRSADPLAAETPEGAIAAQIFLEPVAPMIQAGLQAAKEKMQTEIQDDISDEEMPFDPNALGSMMGMYMDGVQTLVSNTSSIQMALDVEAGSVRYMQAVVPKAGSGFAEFVAAQKGGMPEVARMVNAPSAAVFMAGQLTLSDENRDALTGLVESYVNLISGMFTPDEAPTAPADGEAASPELEKAQKLWSIYMQAMSATSDRWVDCFRGDMAIAYDFGPEGFAFTQAHGLADPGQCRNLMSEMSHQFADAFSEHAELADLFTITTGPKIGGVATEVTTLKMDKLMQAMMPMSDEDVGDDVEEALTNIYGKEMTFATASMDDVSVIAGGQDATVRLKAALTAPTAKAALPSFEPLKAGPGFFGVVHLGRLLDGVAGMIPDEADEIGEVAAMFADGSHRIPFGLHFEPNRAAFELAVPLNTIEAIATFAAEQREEDEERPVLEEAEPDTE